MTAMNLIATMLLQKVIVNTTPVERTFQDVLRLAQNLLREYRLVLCL